MLRLSPVLALASLAVAQGETFSARRPLFRLSVHDLPGLVAAVERTAVGKLLADPEVAEVCELAQQRDAAQVERWRRYTRRIAAEIPEFISFQEGAELELRALDWRDLHDFEIAASQPGDDPDDLRGLSKVAMTFALQATPAATARFTERATAFVTDLRERPPSGSRVAERREVDGHAALVLDPTNGMARPIWIATSAGSVAGGIGHGSDAVGRFVTRNPAAPPGLALATDLARYVRMVATLFSGSSSEVDPFLAAIGVANTTLWEYRLAAVGERLQTELAIALDGEPVGLLAALLSGFAPLPEQPLPADALLQLRCAFDVPGLVRAVDRLLELSGLRPLGDPITADLRAAWTGGGAFAITRPAVGSPVPHVYASFGIVDPDALDRLLAALRAQPWVATRTRELVGVPCTLLEIAGLPAALSPACCVRNGTFHLAESAAGLRALLAAADAGAAAVLDVGDAPLPAGEGAPHPMFELRFDGGAIHAALQEIWLPLAAATAATAEAEPLLAVDELPDVETVSRCLGCGRGMLRRTAGGIVLSCTSPLGGPELLALATTYGPILSSEVTRQRDWTYGNVYFELVCHRMQRLSAAIAAFAQREGKPPPTLGALVAAGDVDAALLELPGDELAEPVVHGGERLGLASFRYYPDGLPLTIEGNPVRAQLIPVAAGPDCRVALDTDGGVHQGWGEFHVSSIDEIERAARAGANGGK